MEALAAATNTFAADMANLVVAMFVLALVCGVLVDLVDGPRVGKSVRQTLVGLGALALFLKVFVAIVLGPAAVTTGPLLAPAIGVVFCVVTVRGFFAFLSARYSRYDLEDYPNKLDKEVLLWEPTPKPALEPISPAIGAATNKMLAIDEQRHEFERRRGFEIPHECAPQTPKGKPRPPWARRKIREL